MVKTARERVLKDFCCRFLFDFLVLSEPCKKLEDLPKLLLSGLRTLLWGYLSNSKSNTETNAIHVSEAL